MSLFLKDYLALHNLPIGVGYDMIANKKPFSFLCARRIDSWVTRCTYRLRKILTKRVRIYLQCKRPGFDSWFRKIPWRRKWQPTPVLLPGKFHGLRSLVSYNPWGRKESDTTEWLDFIMDTLSLTKEARLYNGEKTISLTSDAGKTAQPLVNEWN